MKVGLFSANLCSASSIDPQPAADAGRVFFLQLRHGHDCSLTLFEQFPGQDELIDILFPYHHLKMVTTSRQGQMLLCATGICALLFFIIPSSTRTSSQLLSFARQSSNTGDEAFLTVLSGLQYFAGALTLGHSLDLHAGIRKRRKLALVPHQAIDEPEHVRMLETAGWEIIPVAQLDLPGQVESVPPYCDELRSNGTDLLKCSWHFVDMQVALISFCDLR